jgi:hypothetical protein
MAESIRSATGAKDQDPNAVYSLGSSHEESARLQRQAEELAADSLALLDRVGLRPVGMRFVARRSTALTVVLLGAFGLLIGLAVAPTVAYYGAMDPRALWQAGGATALFIAAFGAAGYATRRDLTGVARVSF